MHVLLLAQTDPQPIWEWLNSIGTVGLAFIVLALIMGWFRLAREVIALEKSLAEMRAERDEYKNLYLRRSEVVGDAIELAKQRR